MLTKERLSEEGGTQGLRAQRLCVQSRRQSTVWGGGENLPEGYSKANGFSSLFPVMSPSCPVLLQADLERTRKAKRRLE